MKKYEYSMKYYERENRQGFWKAKAKGPDDKWLQKVLPVHFQRNQPLEAEQFLIGFLDDLFATWGIAPKNSEVKPVAKTLMLLAPKWLDLRFNDAGTKINTYGGHESSVRLYILDNPEFPHLSIQNLNVETDLTVSVCREWIQSMHIGASNKLKQIGTIRTLIDDCIAEGWLSEDFTNPFDKKAIRKICSDLTSTKNRKKVETALTAEQVEVLLSKKNSKVQDYRRVRYLLAIATGLRDHESEGLVWSDIHLNAPIPFLSVERQLDKIGCLPFKSYEDLAEQGMSKDQIQKQPNAIMSAPKYHSNRTLPLHPLLVKVLKFWKAKGWKQHVGRAPQKDDPVFARGKFWMRGDRVGAPGNFSHADSAVVLKQDLTRLKLPTVYTDPHTGRSKALNFHSLRHTFATLLNGSGIEEAKIGAMMGHKGGSVTRGYIAREMTHFQEMIGSLPMPAKFALSKGTAIFLGSSATPEPSNVRSIQQRIRKVG